jgi:amine sulfotransferase
LESCVKKIAQFCGIEIAADRMQQILERSSYAFMKQFEKLFDHKEEVIWEQGVKDGSFLRKGKTGEGGIELSEEQQKEFDALYRKKLGAINLDRPATPQENRATA